MTLRTSIETLASEFADNILAAIRESSLEELLGVAGHTRGSSTEHEAPAKRGRPAGKTGRKGRLPRRTAEDIEEMADKIVAYVKSNGSVRAEQIRADLEIDKKEWMKPLQLALDSKGLKKTGNKRATEYTVGAASKGGKKPAKKSAPKKAKAASKKLVPKKKSATPRKSKKKALAALDKHITATNGAAATA
jgi:hypothetical protein